MQRCSLADFTLEASSVVNTAGCSNRFAFNVHSTFATLIHVRLRGLVGDEWDTLWDYYWVMEMILTMAMLLSPCNPFRRRSCPPRSSKCRLSLPRTQSSAAGSPSLTSSRNPCYQQSSSSSSYISLHKSQNCIAIQEGLLARKIWKRAHKEIYIIYMFNGGGLHTIVGRNSPGPQRAKKSPYFGF